MRDVRIYLDYFASRVSLVSATLRLQWDHHRRRLDRLLYETGNDSVTSDVGSGTRVRQVNYGGGDGHRRPLPPRTPRTTPRRQLHPDCERCPVPGHNGTIASGQDLDTLTSFGSSTYTYTEYGGRTISFAGGGYIGGSYNDYESTSQSYTLSDSTSIALGANGTIASGTVASLTTQVYSDSQSFSEYGAANVPDPEGGPPFSGELTQTSVTTSYAYSVNRGTETLGALGTISGGGNSFSFNQSDYNSLWLNSPESDTASYSMNMAGTETYAPAAHQRRLRQLHLEPERLRQDHDHLRSTRRHRRPDQLRDAGHRNGLGHDVRRGQRRPGGQRLDRLQRRRLHHHRLAAGHLHHRRQRLVGHLLLHLRRRHRRLHHDRSGTSTLSASGQSYGLDTVTFSESTSDNDYDTQSFGTTLYDWGTATDYYTNSDVSTITNSNGVITSDDAFVMLDTHSVFGGDVGSW